MCKVLADICEIPYNKDVVQKLQAVMDSRTESSDIPRNKGQNSGPCMEELHGECTIFFFIETSNLD